MKLISMTDFVLETVKEDFNNGEYPNFNFRDRVNSYALFLKKPLQVWMFVPCDEEGNVLELPKREPFQDGQKYDDLLLKYQIAKERCLFEGYDVEKANFITHCFSNIDPLSRLNNNLQLTKTAKQQLGL